MGNTHLLKDEFSSTLSSFNSSHSSLSLSIGNIASLLVKIETVMNELTIKETELKKYDEDLKIRVKDINEREKKVKESEEKLKIGRTIQDEREVKCHQMLERMESNKEQMLSKIKLNIGTLSTPTSPSFPSSSPMVSLSPLSPLSPTFPSLSSLSSSSPHSAIPLSPNISLSPSSTSSSVLHSPTQKRLIGTKQSNSFSFSFSSSPSLSSSSLPSQTIFLSMAISSCPAWGLSINKWFPDNQLHLLYKASRDGWNNEVFHKHCDKKGATLTIIESKGYIFGGYSPADWEATEYKTTKLHKDSFIFTLSNPHSIPPTKYPLQSNAESSIANGKGSSLIFGNDGAFRSDIYVNLNTVKVFLDFPLSYLDTTGKGSLTFCSSRVSDLKNVLVFSVK